MKNIVFFVPHSINIKVLDINHTSILYLYNTNYFFSTEILNNIFINNDFNTITIFNKTSNKKIGLLKNELTLFLFSWDNLFFKKIKFSGKGFKLKKKSNNIFFFFNRAHKCFFIGNKNIVIRLSKNKILLLKNNNYDIIKDSYIIRDIRSMNIFTKRGLRLSRQIVMKKKGKTASS